MRIDQLPGGRNSASLSHYSLTITQFSVSPCWKSLAPFPFTEGERGLSPEGDGGKREREKNISRYETSRVESAVGNRNQPAITPITKSFSPLPIRSLFARGLGTRAELDERFVIINVYISSFA